MSTKDEESALAVRIAALGNARTVALGADAATTGTIRVNPASTMRGDIEDLGAQATLAALPRIDISEERSLSVRPAVDGPNSRDLTVTATLGEGGMGRVHLARQQSLDRDVAVKTLKAEADLAAGIALAREARITGHLSHPGVIPVHAFGADDDGRPLLVMKRVEGTDLLSLIADPSHPLWAERTSAKQDLLTAKLELLIQICRTVEFSHARGIIHRDIKPENVMVGSYGEVYLLDWGIALRKAEAARPGLFGTPAYMAPEMFTGGEIDERTDVYLLGATLHQLLTGTFRHGGDNLMELGQAALASAPVTYPREIPAELADIANRATARSPADRFQSVQELRESLSELLHDRAAFALSVAASERLARLRELLAEAGTKQPADLAAAYRLATEARFGFAQSLREHPTQREALAGARSAVEALAELELLQGHADTAEALLRELSSPNPALLARVTHVREDEQQKKRDQERLVKMDRARDPGVGMLSRNIVAVVFAAAIITFSICFGPGHVTLRDPWMPVKIDVALLGAVGVPSILLRRRLLANAYSRQVAGVLLTILLLMLMNRVACAIVGVDDLTSVLMTDLWISAGVLSGAAVMLDLRVLGPAAMMAGGGVVMRVAPDTPAVFSIATVTALALFAAILWSRGRRSRATAGPDAPARAAASARGDGRGDPARDAPGEK